MLQSCGMSPEWHLQHGVCQIKWTHVGIQSIGGRYAPALGFCCRCDCFMQSMRNGSEAAGGRALNGPYNCVMHILSGDATNAHFFHQHKFRSGFAKSCHVTAKDAAVECAERSSFSDFLIVNKGTGPGTFAFNMKQLQNLGFPVGFKG